MADDIGRAVDFTGYRAHALTGFALDHLRSRDRRRPFFLFLSYVEPHHQNDRKRYEGPLGSQERWKDFVVAEAQAGRMSPFDAWERAQNRFDPR